MPLRSPKMNRFILGFQRRVWWPKWTPASNSCFMVTTATRVLLSHRLRACAATPGEGRPWDSGQGLDRPPGKAAAPLYRPTHAYRLLVPSRLPLDMGDL